MWKVIQYGDELAGGERFVVKVSPPNRDSLIAVAVVELSIGWPPSTSVLNVDQTKCLFVAPCRLVAGRHPAGGIR